ncbi:RmlC-like cupin [Teratosphaeria nubilosa]|uniref:RmlC-like cupin n=1 Tax=Teratosphaeria nubilosa TaxID=161662 RepID=A0A6G1LCR5_9PEZI|nr:RmlC-like cupin [Teratosphaeria nubilosa]
MPAEQKPVIVTQSSTLQTSGGQTEGMIRQIALVNLTPNICASRMIAKPHTASTIHHHDDEDTVVFAFSGVGAVVSNDGKTRQELKPGDFCLIPAFAEHQEVNDGDEDVVWAIIRSGKEPKVVNLPGGWGTS